MNILHIVLGEYLHNICHKSEKCKQVQLLHHQVHHVTKSELQLVGVSAMLLASKYEEMYSPEIGDFVYITDNAYSKGQIRNMEALIFQSLDFNLGKPLCLHFLRRNSKAGFVSLILLVFHPVDTRPQV